MQAAALSAWEEVVEVELACEAIASAEPTPQPVTDEPAEPVDAEPDRAAILALAQTLDQLGSLLKDMSQGLNAMATPRVAEAVNPEQAIQR